MPVDGAESKGQRGGGQAVVDRVLGAVRGLVADGKLVGDDPFVEEGDIRDYSHPWVSKIFGIGHVVDYRAPGEEVGGGLVRELLAWRGSRWSE